MPHLIALSRALSYLSMPGDGQPLPREQRWATERLLRRHVVLFWKRTSNHPSISQGGREPPDDLPALDISPEYQSDFVGQARTLDGFDAGRILLPFLEIANPEPYCPFITLARWWIIRFACFAWTLGPRHCVDVNAWLCCDNNCMEDCRSRPNLWGREFAASGTSGRT
jgi:hypothetical protein